MAFVRVDGADRFYEEVGNGRPCLAMHGGPGVDHTCFRPWLDRLGDVLRLIYYDHRGNGRSSRPPLESITLFGRPWWASCPASAALGRHCRRCPSPTLSRTRSGSE